MPRADDDGGHVHGANLLVVLTLLSGLGSFDGAEVIPAPWDTPVVAAWALSLFPLAVRSGVRET